MAPNNTTVAVHVLPQAERKLCGQLQDCEACLCYFLLGSQLGSHPGWDQSNAWDPIWRPAVCRSKKSEVRVQASPACWTARRWKDEENFWSLAALGNTSTADYGTFRLCWICSLSMVSETRLNNLNNILGVESTWKYCNCLKPYIFLFLGGCGTAVLPEVFRSRLAQWGDPCRREQGRLAGWNEGPSEALGGGTFSAMATRVLFFLPIFWALPCWETSGFDSLFCRFKFLVQKAWRGDCWNRTKMIARDVQEIVQDALNFAGLIEENTRGDTVKTGDTRREASFFQDVEMSLKSDSFQKSVAKSLGWDKLLPQFFKRKLGIHDDNEKWWLKRVLFSVPKFWLIFSNGVKPPQTSWWWLLAVGDGLRSPGPRLPPLTQQRLSALGVVFLVRKGHSLGLRKWGYFDIFRDICWSQNRSRFFPLIWSRFCRPVLYLAPFLLLPVGLPRSGVKTSSLWPCFLRHGTHAKEETLSSQYGAWTTFRATTSLSDFYNNSLRAITREFVTLGILCFSLCYPDYSIYFCWLRICPSALFWFLPWSAALLQVRRASMNSLVRCGSVATGCAKTLRLVYRVQSLGQNAQI